MLTDSVNRENAYVGVAFLAHFARRNGLQNNDVRCNRNELISNLSRLEPLSVAHNSIGSQTAAAGNVGAAVVA